MSNGKVRLLHGNATPSLSKDLLRKMREDLPTTIEYLGIHAEMIRAKFDALVKQGFSEAQALELCKSLF